MIKKLLRTLYWAYRQQFYELFIEEFLGEIPKEINEPAVSFLGQGKERLEKWLLFHAHLLQRRVETDPKKIERYHGMLLYLKLILVVTLRSADNKPPQIKGTVDVEEGEEPKDFLEGVYSAVEGLKKYWDAPEEEISTE